MDLYQPFDAQALGEHQALGLRRRLIEKAVELARDRDQIKEELLAEQQMAPLLRLLATLLEVQKEIDEYYLRYLEIEERLLQLQLHG